MTTQIATRPMQTIPLPPGQKLSLKNDGNLEVVFLGVGNAGTKKNGNLNFLLIKGDEHVMVDFGRTAPDAIGQILGLGTTDIGTLLVTHSHADHIGGIEQMALDNRYFGRKLLGKPKLRMVITKEYEQILWDESLRGGLKHNEEDRALKKLLDFNDYFDAIRPDWIPNMPRATYSVKVGGIDIEMFRTKHVPDNSEDWSQSFTSFGLFVDGHVFISVDTRFDRALIDEYAYRSTVMFHDVQFMPGGVHASLAELKTLPEEVMAKMHPMHYPDNFETQDIAGFADWARRGVRYVFPNVS